MNQIDRRLCIWAWSAHDVDFFLQDGLSQLLNGSDCCTCWHGKKCFPDTICSRSRHDVGVVTPQNWRMPSKLFLNPSRFWKVAELLWIANPSICDVAGKTKHRIGKATDTLYQNFCRYVCWPSKTHRNICL